MEVTLNYDDMVNLLNKIGIDEFFNKFEKEYKSLDLYNMSVDWIKSKKYILKFKGGLGDLLVYWN